jgi:hypothetical protein
MHSYLDKKIYSCKKWVLHNLSHEEEFSNDPRNIIFGLSTDGMNSFGEMRNPRSTWSVIMCIYNLTPWLCHKRKYLLLTTLISGSTQAGIDIDGFLEPLMEDMQKLWEHGVCRCFLYRQDIGWSRSHVHVPRWSCDV